MDPFTEIGSFTEMGFLDKIVCQVEDNMESPIHNSANIFKELRSNDFCQYTHKDYAKMHPILCMHPNSPFQPLGYIKFSSISWLLAQTKITELTGLGHQPMNIHISLGMYCTQIGIKFFYIP